MQGCQERNFSKTIFSKLMVIKDLRTIFFTIRFLKPYMMHELFGYCENQTVFLLN